MTNLLVMVEDDGGASVPFSLPTGVVTFLLTDIEASSRGWENAADAMAPAVARHYEILGAVVDRWGGVRPVEQGEGDSIVAAFSRASEAMGAALDAQRELTAELSGTFAVRVALHTGEAQLRDEGNYFGRAVIRCARLRSCGHGGQILVSHTTADLVGDRLPEGATLNDLGDHRLKDLDRPEHVYELCHPDLPRSGRFPELRSLDAYRHNLPTQMTPLIGRDREIAEVSAMVDRERIVTLTGTGGCGKSRVAAEVGARMADRFPGGVWWCELAPHHEDAAVFRALADAVGVEGSPGRTITADVLDHLAAQPRALVILDNAEHLLDAVARATVDLTAALPEVQALITSREPLSVPGEVAWRVPSLSVPPADVRTPVGQLAEFDAVRLFVERASRSRSDFRLTEENALAIVAICRRLDGVPLAIELAAARVRTLAPDRILAQLDDRFRLLTGGARTLLPRQQTLLASVAWSEALLDDDERAALRRLGVFVGGFSLEAAEAVLGEFDDIDSYQVLDLVGRLVDKSLVAHDEPSGRYHLLETIRSFALSRLLDAEEGDAARDAHLAWAVAFTANRFAVWEYTSAWRASVNVEWPNLAAALDWGVDRPEERCRLVAALGRWWLMSQNVADALTYGLDTIERFAADPPPSWYLALANAAGILGNAAVFDRLVHHAPQATALALEHGDHLAADRIQTSTLGARLLTEGPLDDVLASYVVLQARTDHSDDENLALNARLAPFQALMHGGRQEEARAHAPLVGPRSRVAVAEGWGAMCRGQFEEAAAHLREAALITDAEVRVERMFVASTVTALEILVGAEVPELDVPFDLESTDQFEGLWEMSHLLARARAAVVRSDWGTVAELTTTELPPHAISLRVAPLLAAGLVAGGRVKLARAAALALVERATRMAYPLQAIEGQLVLAEIDGAVDLAYEALGTADRLGLVVAQIDALELIATATQTAGDPERAARLKRAAVAERDRLGYRFRWPSRHAAFDAIEAPGDGPVDALPDAVAYALRGRGERRRPAFGWDALTPAEHEVAGRVAKGLTNPQVAEQMHIGTSTVKTHLDHIYAKLGINSRAELAAELGRRSPAAD